MNPTPNLYSLTNCRWLCGAACVALLCGAAVVANGAPGDTELISATYSSAEAAGESYLFEGVKGSVSADGRFVVFASNATNLVPDVTGWPGGVFVRDRLMKLTQRVSVTPSGAGGNGPSTQPCISANGRFVAFVSAASDLVAGDFNNDDDLFLRDLQTGVTRRVATQAYHPAINADGRFVAYVSGGVFVWDRTTGLREPVSIGMDGTFDPDGDEPSLSADGRFVAFQNYSTGQVLVRDRQQATTELIDVGSSGVEGGGGKPSISADGRFVAFHSYASNFVPGDTNYSWDIFVRDRINRTTELVSQNSKGEIGTRDSMDPMISGDGRYVAFWSEAYNLAPEGDTNDQPDIFVRDRQTGTTERVNVSSTGEETRWYASSWAPSISSDGRFVAFQSRAFNLVANDFNDSNDVFVHERYVPSGVSSFTVKPTAVAFGNQALATSTTLSFWLTNKGTTPLPIASVGLVGTNPGMFSLGNGCGTSLTVGSYCRIRVTFRPTSVGAKSATLRLVVGDNEVRTQALSGTGVISTFTVSPTSLGFGSVPINTISAAKLVKISNTGSAVLPISSIALGGWNPYQFAQTNNCPANLAVGATCRISVVFKPTKEGSKAALVQIRPGSGSGAIRSVALAGSARR